MSNRNVKKIKRNNNYSTESKIKNDPKSENITLLNSLSSQTKNLNFMKMSSDVIIKNEDNNQLHNNKIEDKPWHKKQYKPILLKYESLLKILNNDPIPDVYVQARRSFYNMNDNIEAAMMNISTKLNNIKMKTKSK